MAKSVENRHRDLPNSPPKRSLGRVLLDAIADSILGSILFVFRFIGWTVRWSFATLFFIGVMGLAAWFVFNEAVAGGGVVVVPNVTGLQVIQATNVLAGAGLEVGKQETIVSDRLPEYHVLMQRPAAGKVIRSGREIALTISAGKKDTPTPNLVGRDIKAAMEQLGTTQFLPGMIARVPSQTTEGIVLAQDPRPEKPARDGSDIHLLVSAGPARGDARMPDLVGTPIQSAMDHLAKFDVEVVPILDNDAEGDYDVVLAQTPEPESPLASKQSVTLTVRPRAVASLPNMRRTVNVEYIVPNVSFSPQMRVEIVNPKDGRRELKYPLARDLVAGEPPRLSPGSVMTIPNVTFSDEIRIEFFADNKLHMTYTYALEGDPVKRVINQPNAGGGAVASSPLPSAPNPAKPVQSAELPPPTATQTPPRSNEVEVEVFEPRTERVGPAPRQN